MKDVEEDNEDAAEKNEEEDEDKGANKVEEEEDTWVGRLMGKLSWCTLDAS